MQYDWNEALVYFGANTWIIINEIRTMYHLTLSTSPKPWFA